jgi:hypothetical protein
MACFRVILHPLRYTNPDLRLMAGQSHSFQCRELPDCLVRMMETNVHARHQISCEGSLLPYS